ncbi:hypothetical protein K439DRAFT_150540 [Ramaria rubella]|nr:hypothetical protein K439DRAFT_150540 [Ramaria rubella]
MSHRLADELLQIILAPLLHVSDERFTSDSPTAFGSNVNFSSSSLLLVCKRWLRVATPLLYEVVVLRSIAQAQSIVDSFIRNRTFALYVKKIRLEGAYSCLWEVFRRCSSLHTIFLTLDLYAGVTVTGLCRSLLVINPTCVILQDKSDTNNVKVKQVFAALLRAIPLWTNLREFYFPYGLGVWRHGLKPEELAEVLVESPTLRTLYAEFPFAWNAGVWSMLAANTNLMFKFHGKAHEAHNLSSVLQKIIKMPGLLERIDLTQLTFIP